MPGPPSVPRSLMMPFSQTGRHEGLSPPSILGRWRSFRRSGPFLIEALTSMEEPPEAYEIGHFAVLPIGTRVQVLVGWSDWKADQPTT